MDRLGARLAAMLWTIAAVTAASAAAQQAGTPAAMTPPPPLATDTTTDTATDTALSLGAAQNRMTVPVAIDTRGPWPFVIDTGAERTVVSRELAATLGLAAGPSLRVVAMTGPSIVPSVLVPALSVSALAQPTIVAPALEERNIGAPGMLGIDTLQGHSIDIDFDRSAMTVRPSRKRHVRAGVRGDEVVVVARSRFGQLIVTDARWRGRRISVVVDTGSSMTVGNPALLAMIGGQARPLGPTAALSVTGLTLQAQAFVVDDVAIGGIGLANMPVAIADAAPFHRFGLRRRPALLLGMDTLRLFRRVRIDFANRDIELTLPRGEGRRLGLPGS